MQVRKLIRLLNEIVAKDPSMKYAEACIDTELGKLKSPHYKYYSVPDVKIRDSAWESNSGSEIQKRVVVIGNY